MFFIFENGCKLTEALVTAMQYDDSKEMYELTVLGLGKDGFSFTEPGTAWFDEEDIQELMDAGELEFPHEIIGRKLKLVANGIQEKGNNGDENE